jgi:histidinol dehydrogenase
MLAYRLSEMTDAQLRSVMSRGDVDLSEPMRQAKKIIDDVRRRGDKALRTYARRFDGFKGGLLTLSEDDVRFSADKISKEVLAALRVSKKRIETFHKRQMPKSFEYSDSSGFLGQRTVPLDRVGVYVPGGTAAYMSSVLMACVPARVAGVEDVAICTPGKSGLVPEEILAAADLCGVREVHPIGGAHSIAAMAYGTNSIRKVQKIVGPGGAFVTAAKLLVRNDCEIDFLAGPSEVLIIADEKADPELLALDMLAQLEHDPLARALLVTTSEDVLETARDKLERKLVREDRRDILQTSSERGAIFVLVDKIGEAVSFSNEYAPEHLLIDVEKPRRLLDRVRSAGSVFLGRYSSVAFGDYCSGTNHILPTKGVAAVRSSLTVNDFLKVIPYQELSAHGARKLSKTVEILARSEGLPAHAEAALARARKVKR